jgi:hypothetical protein
MEHFLPTFSNAEEWRGGNMMTSENVCEENIQQWRDIFTLLTII